MPSFSFGSSVIGCGARDARPWWPSRQSFPSALTGLSASCCRWHLWRGQAPRQEHNLPVSEYDIVSTVCNKGIVSSLENDYSRAFIHSSRAGLACGARVLPFLRFYWWASQTDTAQYTVNIFIGGRPDGQTLFAQVPVSAATFFFKLTVRSTATQCCEANASDTISVMKYTLHMHQAQDRFCCSTV